MPAAVLFHLVREWRARPHQRHVTAEDVPELRQLVETGLAKHASQGVTRGSFTSLNTCSIAGCVCALPDVMKLVTYARCRAWSASTYMVRNLSIVKGFAD